VSRNTRRTSLGFGFPEISSMAHRSLAPGEIFMTYSDIKRESVLVAVNLYLINFINLKRQIHLNQIVLSSLPNSK
jgi:hypothetical protein